MGQGSSKKLSDDEKYDLYRGMRVKNYRDKLGQLFRADKERIDVLTERAEICAQNLEESREQLAHLQERAAAQSIKVQKAKRYSPIVLIVLTLIFCAIFAIVAGTLVARGFKNRQLCFTS